jgi:nucleoside-diphosphate-sugar epimerase
MRLDHDGRVQTNGNLLALQPGRGRSALITGGAGFIGSHLAELLLADGWAVYALDDVSTGSLANVEHLRGHPDFHLVVDSVLSRAIVNELVHKCDVVYHLAAAVGVRLIVQQPVHTIVTNIEGTETVLEYCSRSSSHPHRRSTVTTAPRFLSPSRLAVSTGRRRRSAGHTRARRRWTSF